MVSFQCHACGDVVKKPKLDQHRSRCHTGFDCIDCSKTFNTPTEYKDHTSCISEAEKYQKSLYKGHKTEQKSINHTQQSNSLPDKKSNVKGPSISRQSNAQWSRNPLPTSTDNVNGYTGTQYQPRRNYSGRGANPSSQNRFSRPSASGANDTPLGIPKRSSVDDQTGVARVSGTNHVNFQVEATLKKKHKQKEAENAVDCSSQTGIEKSTKPDAASAQENPSVVDVKEKVKKRKKKETNGEPTGPETAEPAAVADPDVKEEKKKKRKEKKANALGDAVAASAEDRNEELDQAGSEDKKKVKKDKKRKAREQSETAVAEDVTIPAPVEEQSTKTKKRKNKGITNGDIVTSAPEHEHEQVDSIAETTHVDQEDKQRKKKEKKRGSDEKEKKRKRHEEPKEGTAKKRRRHTTD